MISVVIPTNTTDGLLRSIESCSLKHISQIFVISNNCESETLTQISAVANLFKKVRHEHLIQGGSNRARNLGLAKCQTKWIIFLDCGDLLLPLRGDDSFSHLVSSNSEVETFVYDYEESDSFDSCGIRESTLIGRDFDINSLFEKHIQTQSCTISKDFLIGKKISWDEELSSSQDFDFYFQCIKANPSYIYVQEPGYQRIISAFGISSDWKMVSLSQEVVLRKHRAFIYSSALSSRSAQRLFSVYHLNGRSRLRTVFCIANLFGARNSLRAVIAKFQF